MIKPLWALAGVAFLGVAGIAGAVIVASSGGEEEVIQQVGTATTSASPTAAPSVTPTANAAATQQPSPPTPTQTPPRTTFTNTKHGFAFDYPADWFIDPHNVRDDTTSDYIDLYNYLPYLDPQGPFPPSPGTYDNKVRIEFYISDNAEGLSLDDWVQTFNSNPDPPKTVITSNRIAVNGLEGIIQTSARPNSTAGNAAFFYLGPSVLFVNGPNVDSRFVAAYEDIISSLRRA